MSSKNAKARARAERAAAALAEAKRRERQRNIRIGIGVVLAIVVIIGAGFAINKLQGSQDNDEVARSVPAFGETQYGLVTGDPDAPHTLVVYEDFLCPICGAFEQEFNEKAAALVESGALAVEYRPFVLLDRFGSYSADSLNAFYAVRDAAGDDAAKEMHDLLYGDQPSEEGPFPDSSALLAKAVQAGASEADVKDAIENAGFADQVSGATDEALGDGVQSTPTVILDGAVLPPTNDRVDTIVAAASADAPSSSATP